ncbi:MAG TPA: radical SAM family heme chaperone HemW [Bacteroidia bacterium]|jgi:oxygen-independent coproporphyrinogen-3 oxidase|nr:radical SAM family heme chaperone HemW [Bacteroidia bacterium]
MSGLYIHIPFCRKACTYCDFHFSTNLEKQEQLVNAICKEIKERKNYLADKKLNSIYFGGGTPSILNVAEVKKILDSVYDYFEVDKSAEVTFELNPEDAEPKYLSEIRKTGVNRLSVGLQSFNNEELQWMNRVHTAQQSVDCIKIAKESGFENISIDLIYGSRFQNGKSWKSTLQKVFDLNVPHISSYNLTIEGKTKLHDQLQKKAEPEVDTELSSRLFDILMEEMQKHGYEHYEISNFCKPGFMAVHNSSYWKGAHYLGVGPAAHSYNGVSRRFNMKSNSGYLRAIEAGKNYWEEEILTEADKYNEYVLTRLRTNWGCDTDEIAELFGHKYKEYFIRNLHQYETYISRNKNKITLNKKGKHFADGIASDLFLTSGSTE